MPIDVKKTLEKLDAAVAKSQDADVLKALHGIKEDITALSVEKDELEKSKKELDDANHKLTDALKQSIISGPAKSIEEDKAGGAASVPPKDFEEILKEKIAESKKGK